MNKIDKTETLTKILAHRRFTVDVFQREYRWGRKQIEQMLSDFQGTFEEYYDPDTDRKWATDVCIRKNRNGAVWEVELHFEKEIMKFVETKKEKKWDGTY